jgi:AbrB family looped-hinge helix DNA binding protein
MKSGTEWWENINCRMQFDTLEQAEMPKRTVGPKGQIVIPKRLRETADMKPGTDVTLEMRDGEIVITKLKVEGNYTEHYTSTSTPKLKKSVNIKEIISEEECRRHALP